MRDDSLVVGILSVVGLIAFISVVWGLYLGQRHMKQTHIERMRALELGREWHDPEAHARLMAAFGQKGDPEDGSPGSLARKCYSTAIWTGFWGFAAAGGVGPVQPTVAYFIASAVGAVGVTAVICGTVLTARVQDAAARRLTAKPRVDDPLEFASARH